jgi:hypothetical protein
MGGDMPQFAIIDVESGLTVVQLPAGASAAEVAVRQGGSVVDPGPYATYDDAYDALLALPEEETDGD